MTKGPHITPFLMFAGNAEEAMKFYVSVFDNSQIVHMTKYGPNQPGREGSILHAAFSLNGHQLMCIDSPVEHEFTFTPAISLHVSCDDEAQVVRCFEALAQDGQVLMPLDTYPFSQKYGWVQDRFGVSWQISVT